MGYREEVEKCAEDSIPYFKQCMKDGIQPLTAPKTTINVLTYMRFKDGRGVQQIL